MKKLLSIILAILMIVSSVPFAFAADTVAEGTCGENLTWTLDDGGTLIIKGEGAMADYSYGTAPWYLNSSSIESVVIESGVTTICRNAFSGFSSIRSVTIPDSVTSIGDNAFSDCRELISVTIPEGVKSIGNAAFAYCRSLTSITISEGVKIIGLATFEGCASLMSVTIPGSVYIIRDYAFESCYSLRSAHYLGSSNNVFIYDNNSWLTNVLHYCDYGYTKSPTCTQNGYTSWLCKYCSYPINVTIEATGHNYDTTKSEANLTRPTQNEDGTWNDGYYTYTCKNDSSHTTTETVKRADYTAYDAAVAALNELLENDKLTEKTKAAINTALTNNKIAENLIESEAATVTDATANLVATANSIDEGIADGTAVKADYSEIEEAIAKIDDALKNATISEEMKAELEDIQSDLEALKENTDASKVDVADDLAALTARADAIEATMNACASGTHSFTTYTESKVAECEVNAEETASCDNGCGATDTREVANSALGHTREEGNVYCTVCNELIGCEHCGKEHTSFIDDIICAIKRFFNMLKDFITVIDPEV